MSDQQKAANRLNAAWTPNQAHGFGVGGQAEYLQQHKAAADIEMQKAAEASMNAQWALYQGQAQPPAGQDGHSPAQKAAAHIASLKARWAALDARHAAGQTQPPAAKPDLFDQLRKVVEIFEAQERDHFALLSFLAAYYGYRLVVE